MWCCMMRRWKDQHCRRQTPPLPGCLFQPCFKIHDSSFQSVMIGRWCQSCGVCSDRSPSCRGLPQGRMHGTRLFTSKSRTQDHTLANLAGPDRGHEIVHGAKVLEVTVVSAVLLRWLMKRPVSLERLASLVSVCFIFPKNVVAESPGAAVTATVVAAPLNCKSTLHTYCRVFCVPCDFRQGDVCSWTVLTCGHTVYLQRTTREYFDRRFLAG